MEKNGEAEAVVYVERKSLPGAQASLVVSFLFHTVGAPRLRVAKGGIDSAKQMSGHDVSRFARDERSESRTAKSCRKDD